MVIAADINNYKKEEFTVYTKVYKYYGEILLY